MKQKKQTNKKSVKTEQSDTRAARCMRKLRKKRKDDDDYKCRRHLESATQAAVKKELRAYNKEVKRPSIKECGHDLRQITQERGADNLSIHLRKCKQPGKGFGVLYVGTKDIIRGDELAEYTGLICDEGEEQKRGNVYLARRTDVKIVRRRGVEVRVQVEHCIDGSNSDSIAKFINHGCRHCKQANCYLTQPRKSNVTFTFDPILTLPSTEPRKLDPSLIYYFTPFVSNPHIGGAGTPLMVVASRTIKYREWLYLYYGDVQEFYNPRFKHTHWIKEHRCKCTIKEKKQQNGTLK